MGSRGSVLSIGLAILILASQVLVETGCSPVSKLSAMDLSSSATQKSDTATSQPIMVSAQLGVPELGVPYSGKVTATGGTAPYHFWMRFGQLPAGLKLNQSSGVISGTPTTAETRDFTVRVSNRHWNGHSDLGLRLTVGSKSTGVTIAVSPASANVASGASQQLVAVVRGSRNTEVRWSASVGTVSTSGLFTAPTVSTATTATITATSAAVSSAKASSAIAISPVTSSVLTVSGNRLPDAAKGTSYSAGLSATGGSQPYSWKLETGSLPTGVSLDAAGILSGRPSQAGSFSFTAQVTDSKSHTASGPIEIVVNVPNANAKFDGPAELPRVYVQSALANTPANGKTLAAADSASFQAALNSAACGDTISLKSGSTFTGTFNFPGKNCDDQHWIIVRTSAPDSSLPPEGTRISPCYAGVSSLPGRPALNCSAAQNVMAKVVMGPYSGSGPIAFTAGANHYRLIGLEITRLPNALPVGNLAYPTAGSSGDHIIFDRVWMHGTPKDDTTRGIYLSGLSYVALVDSYLNDFHCETVSGRCTDAQTVSGGLGTIAGGTYKIANNFLESAAENILFGGGHATYTPGDIEVSHNHFFKPLTWRKGSPNQVLGNHGQPFVVKNHFELKNAQRVLFEGNIAENTWGGFSQPGFTLVLTPKNQMTVNGGVCPICQVTDVTIRNSKFSHMGSGFQIANALESAASKVPPLAGARYSIHDVVLEDIDDVTYAGQGQLAQISTGLFAPLLSDLQMTHITAFPHRMLFDIGNGTSPKMPNFVFSNSIVTAGLYPVWGAGGLGSICSANHSTPLIVLNACFTNYTFSSNILIGVPSQFPAAVWPSGNDMANDGNSVGFVAFKSGNGGDYHLQPNSNLKKSASDGKDPGADIDAILAATQGAE
jgi:Putative Ig domain